jgi:D-alanyl-lipoteichoic acid acyltransferase DltB (MBOAT superfamily)
MLFNSFEFLLFFIFISCLYYAIKHKYRWLILTIASYYFYAQSGFYLVFLLLISTITDYIAGLKIEKSKSANNKRLFLIISICINVGILFFFKYYHFFSLSFQTILQEIGLLEGASQEFTGYHINEILIPVGISFYTFQTMSYTIEVYRGKLRAETHFGKFALYVSFFPQLVAGPIEKATRLLPQFYKKITFSKDSIKKGLALMAWGFFLKLVVADRLGLYVDMAFYDPELYNGLPLILGAIFFGFQIYYDFAAYTAIAIGSAKVLGINLINNFNKPFFATSAASFWRRWHISLMNWMRDYLYKPLVRNYNFSRKIALLLIFFVIGLWHGANWTFVIWGVLNGVFLIAEIATIKLRKKVFHFLNVPKRLIKFFGWCIVMAYLCLTLVFFRSPSLSESILYLKNMFTITNLHINILDNYFELFICIVAIAFVQYLHYVKGNKKIYEIVFSKSLGLRWCIYITYILIIIFFSINRQHSFIYFQF